MEQEEIAVRHDNGFVGVGVGVGIGIEKGLWIQEGILVLRY